MNLYTSMRISSTILRSGIVIHLLHRGPVGFAFEWNLHRITKGQSLVVARSGVELCHVALEIVAVIFVVAELEPAPVDPMEKNREVAKMVLFQQVAHARMAVGMQPSVFIDAFGPQLDHHANTPRSAIMTAGFRARL